MHQNMHREGSLTVSSSWQHALSENPLDPGPWGGREFPSASSVRASKTAGKAMRPVPKTQYFHAGSSHVTCFPRAKAAWRWRGSFSLAQLRTHFCGTFSWSGPTGSDAGNMGKG